MRRVILFMVTSIDGYVCGPNNEFDWENRDPEVGGTLVPELLQTTDGNLSIHARKLEDAGYVSCKKSFAARVPKTEFSLTAKGKRMFARHLEHMEALIHAAKGTSK